MSLICNSCHVHVNKMKSILQANKWTPPPLPSPHHHHHPLCFKWFKHDLILINYTPLLLVPSRCCPGKWRVFILKVQPWFQEVGWWLSPHMRGAVLINVETTPLSLLIFHLGDTGELWHQPGMLLIKAGTHLPLPAVNKTPLMAFCPGLEEGVCRDYPHPCSNEWKQTLPNLWHLSFICLWFYLEGSYKF